MLRALRVRATATLVAATFALTACEPAEKLPTTVDPVEMEADVAGLSDAFESPATDAFVSLGFAIDDAIFGSGALLRLPAVMLAEGPTSAAVRFREALITATDDDVASAIPLSALGKTFTYNITTDRYEISGLTGAPANGVRFLLYTTDGDDVVIEPLVQVGWVDISRSGSAGSLSGRIEIYLVGGTKVMDYTAVIGGTTNFPTVAVSGFAGLGAGRVDFSLNSNVSVITSNLVIIWQTDHLLRGTRSRVQMAISPDDYPDVTIGAMLRAGVRKVEIGGTLVNDGADVLTGDLTVEIGDRVFAIVHVGAETDTVTDENGSPLTPADEETLLRIYYWFVSALSVPLILLGPLFTVLDIPPGLF